MKGRHDAHALFRHDTYSTQVFRKSGITLVSLLCALGCALGQQGSVSDIATSEVMRRQQMVQQAQKLVEAGAVAQADRSYGEAMDFFQAAFEALPDSRATDALRRTVYRRYQSATAQYAQQMIDGAQWPEARRSITQAMKLGAQADMPPSSLDPGLSRLLKQLDDPDYYTQAITPRHLENVDKVKRLLKLGQGAIEYGKFDQAEKAFIQVLNIDPTNAAARRGMEQVERHRLNYYEVAYDQTRATKMREVAQEWELPVPRLGAADISVEAGRIGEDPRAVTQNKLNTIIVPSIEFDDTPLADVLIFLDQRAAELDPEGKGLNFVLDTGTFGAGENPGAIPVTFKIVNAPLAAVLGYVTQLAGVAYRVDQYSIMIVSKVAGSQRVLDTRTWTVPPGFISGGGAAAAAGPVDPFAAPADDAGGGLVKKKTPQEFLEENGVDFGPGASANFVAATSTLMVRNTPEALDLIDSLVNATREAGSKVVEVGVKILRVSEEIAKSKGLDLMLGPSNIGPTPRTFIGGGTDGNSVTPSLGSDFTFGAVGAPVTSGLRTGSSGALQTIDEVLNNGVDTSDGLDPAVFSVAGIFTDPSFQATVRMLENIKGVDSLCESKVYVVPGQRALMEVGREFIYPTEYDPPEIPNDFITTTFVVTDIFGNIISAGSTSGAGFPATPATPTAFEMRKLGKVLEVTPTVDATNKKVTVDVLVDMSEFVGFINYGTPIRDATLGIQGNGQLPVITENEILMPVFEAVKETTSVTVWDGNTIAIGGYFGHTVEDIEDKIPVLGDLPAVGAAFRNQRESHQKQGFLIFLSVRVVDPGGQPLNSPLSGEYDGNAFPPESGNPPQSVPTPIYTVPSSAGGGYQK